MFRFGGSHARLVVRRNRLVPNTFQKEVPTWRHVADPLHAQANQLPAQADVVAHGAVPHPLVAVPAGGVVRVGVEVLARVVRVVVAVQAVGVQMRSRRARKRSRSVVNKSRVAKRFASC